MIAVEGYTSPTIRPGRIGGKAVFGEAKTYKTQNQRLLDSSSAGVMNAFLGVSS
jgi:hypothetical protein